MYVKLRQRYVFIVDSHPDLRGILFNTDRTIAYDCPVAINSKHLLRNENQRIVQYRSIIPLPEELRKEVADAFHVCC